MKQRHAEQQVAAGLRLAAAGSRPRPGRPGWRGCGARVSACRSCRRCGNRPRRRCREILRPLTRRSDGCALISSPNEWMPACRRRPGRPARWPSGACSWPRTCSTFCQMSVPGIGPSATSTLVCAASRISAIWCGSKQRVDGVGDAGGLGAEQRDEGIRHQRQQEAHDIVRADAQRMKHVGGLRDAADEIAVADHGAAGRPGRRWARNWIAGASGLCAAPSLIAS